MPFLLIFLTIMATYWKILSGRHGSKLILTLDLYIHTFIHINVLKITKWRVHDHKWGGWVLKLNCEFRWTFHWDSASECVWGGGGEGIVKLNFKILKWEFKLNWRKVYLSATSIYHDELICTLIQLKFNVQLG